MQKKTNQFQLTGISEIIEANSVALPIEDRERNLRTKSILARVYTLNVCGYSTLLRSIQ